MKNIIKSKIFLVGLLALATLLPAGFVSAQGATPTVSYPSPAATSVTSSSATLNANVNPSGSSTNVSFEIQGIGTISSCSQNIGSGSSNVAVTCSASNLSAGTNYSFRAVAMNANGGTNGQYQNFSTVSVNKPSISGSATSNITCSSATISGQVNPNGSSTNTWFIVSNISGSVSPQNIGGGSSNTNVSYNLSGLAASTQYSFRIEAANMIGNTEGNTVTFNTIACSNNNNNSAPSITTSTASSIDCDSATLNADYNSNGTTTYVRFAYGESSSNLNNYTSYQSVGTGFGSTARSISGLDSDTTHYFRAEAYNGLGGSSSSSPIQGTVRSFTTDDDCSAPDNDNDDEPNISTDGASSITSASARLNAVYDANGDDTFIRFDYGTSSSNLSYHTDYENVGDDSGSFDEKITGLNSNTTYYFRAVGYNDEGSDNGSVYSFKTLDSDDSDSGKYPVVTTKFVSSLGKTSVKLNGSAVNSYNLPVKAWFEYGKSVSLGSQTSKQSVGSGSSINFSANLSNLDSNTIYYFRAMAENDGGQNKGEILVFRTSAVTVTDPSNNPVSDPVVPTVSTSNGNLVSLEIEAVEGKIAPEQVVEYFINYRNNSDKEIKDISINVTLPREIKLLRSSDGKLNLADNSLNIKVASLGAGEGRVLYIQGQVDANAEVRENVISSVVASYQNPNTKEREEVLGYIVTDIVSRGNQLAAAAIFGDGGILPNTIAEWIILIIVIGALVYVGRKVYLDLEKKKVMKNAPDNLPR